MGQVVDATSKKGVAGAIVTISGSTFPVVLQTGETVVNNALATSPSDAPRQILTGPSGQFLFRALPAGRYQLRASAPGYIYGSYGQSRPNGAEQSIELGKDSDRRGDLTLRIWKAATISGRVTDEAGEPVVSAEVRGLRRTVINGQPRFASTFSATDDRGIYRLTGLMPGDYVVAIYSPQVTMPAATADSYMQLIMTGGTAASDLSRELSSSDAPYPGSGGYRIGDQILVGGIGRGLPIAPPTTDDARMLAYPPLFYPASSTPAQATLITIGSGEDRASVDLQLKLVPTIRVSGIVTGPDGPVRNLGLKLYPAGADETLTGSGFETASTVTDAAGAFTFLGVTPGPYTLKSLRMPRPVSQLSASSTSIEISAPGGGLMMGISSAGPASGPGPPLPTDPTLYGNMAVTVGETDVTGLSLSLHVGARVSGRIEFDGTREPPPPDVVQRTSISINPISGATPVGFFLAAKRVEADRRFATVGYPPGRYTVSASIPVPIGPAAGPWGNTVWRLKSATVSGRNVLDDGLTVDAEDIRDLVLTFTDRSSDVTGTVTNAAGQPDKAAAVIVIPADSQAWRQGTPNARRLRNVRPATSGQFSLIDLPAGAYFLAAVNDEGLDNWQDPKTLDAIVRVATRITLRDGEKLTQNLTTHAIR